MPLQQQSGFSFPMIANGPRGHVNYTYQDTVSLIKYSIEQILLTLPGERIWNPAFGCRLRRLSFESLTETMQTTAKNLILFALAKWESRITVQASDITISISDDIGSTVSIAIGFGVINPDFTTSRELTTVVIIL